MNASLPSETNGRLISREIPCFLSRINRCVLSIPMIALVICHLNAYLTLFFKILFNSIP